MRTTNFVNMMRDLKFLVLFIFFSSCGLVVNTSAQKSGNATNNIWSGSFGVRIQSTDQLGGIGSIFSIGRVMPIHFDNRVRFHPSVRYARFFNDPFEKGTNPSNLLDFNIDLDYDLIRINSFSVLTSVGGFIGNVFSSDFNKFHVGFNAAVGIRIAPYGKNISYALKLAQLQGGTKGYFSGGSSFGIEMNLN